MRMPTATVLAPTPVNAPRCPVNSYQRDGSMVSGSNGGAAPHYEPNSYADAPKQAPHYAEPALALSGAADRYDHSEDTDYYSKWREQDGI